jgi:hypothetical protein
MNKNIIAIAAAPLAGLVISLNNHAAIPRRKMMEEVLLRRSILLPSLSTRADPYRHHQHKAYGLRREMATVRAPMNDVMELTKLRVSLRP